MTSGLLDLAEMASDVGLAGHLAECGEASDDWRACRWCLSAVSTPGISLPLDARRDARALLRSDADGTVGWVVAATELLRMVDAVDLREVTVPSVRALAERVHRATTGDLSSLRRRLDATVAPGGPVEWRCRQTAGAIAAAAVQLPEHRRILDRLPAATRDQLVELSATLSTGVQVAGLLPAVERLHWQGLPSLHTQPEWRRLPPPGNADRHVSRRVTAARPAPGSLEELVVESMIDRVTTALFAIGEDLASAAPPVSLSRDVAEARASPATRALMWRIANVDWHLTFVDTGRADCWNARVEDDLVVTDVPWHVALAIDAAEPHGLVSAIHQERPSRPARPRS